MDHRRVSAITHGDLEFHNPVSPAAVDEMLERLDLSPDDRIADVGCGPGELLVRAAERAGCGGVGVDADPASIDEARRRAAARAPEADLVFEMADAGDTTSLVDGGFTVAACLGSTHALGGLAPALRRLASLTRPGGQVMVADGYWRRRPDAAYLEALGGSGEDELTDLAGLVGAGEAAGLSPAYLLTVGQAEWDRYEWTLIHNGLRFAARHPDDPAAADVMLRVEAARARCLMPGGRETLGFAIVLWLRPG